ncbi:MAG: 5'-nucleotidase [Flavobacteriaceae bacterium]
MYLKIKHFVIYITIGFCFSCKNKATSLNEIKGTQIIINSSLTSSDTIEAFITPYRARINEVLDSTLTYTPKTITKEDGAYNTTAGNLLADIVLSMAGPVFESRTTKTIDFVLLNHGGIRSIISKGKVNARNAYEVMPFENSIVIAELDGASVMRLISYLIEERKPHPISGIQIVLAKNNELHALHIQGKAFDKNRTYYIATSDYLATGGDRMYFFKEALQITETDYLIRNAMIDYFKKVDTLSPKIDQRFYKLK